MNALRELEITQLKYDISWLQRQQKEDDARITTLENRCTRLMGVTVFLGLGLLVVCLYMPMPCYEKEQKSEPKKKVLQCMMKKQP